MHFDLQPGHIGIGNLEEGRVAIKVTLASRGSESCIAAGHDSLELELSPRIRGSSSAAECSEALSFRLERTIAITQTGDRLACVGIDYVPGCLVSPRRGAQSYVD